MVQPYYSPTGNLRDDFYTRYGFYPTPLPDTRTSLENMARAGLLTALHAGKFAGQMLIPQDLTDLGLMVAGTTAAGPAGLLATPFRRAALGGAMMALDPDEAQAALKYRSLIERMNELLKSGVKSDAPRRAKLAQRVEVLEQQAAPLRDQYDAAVRAHWEQRPSGMPRNEWAGRMEFTPENREYRRIVAEANEANRELSRMDNSVAKRQVMGPLMQAISQHEDAINRAHKTREMNFTAIPLEAFRDAPSIRLYKSPVHNRRQSSEYRLLLDDSDVPYYARKSNHWGQFQTNITSVDDAVRELGITPDEARVRELLDPFGRIGTRSFNWNLVGGDSASRASQAGAIPLEELIEILRKHALLPAAIGGGAAAAAPPVGLLEQ